jgi:hypothetical protein
MNLIRLAGSLAKEDFSRHAEAGRFVALETIASTKDCNRVIGLLGDVVLHQFDNARAFFPALEWAVNEVMDNIHIHAESPVPGVVCAQYYPKLHRFEVGISDMGRGIRASLGPRFPELDSDEKALHHAIKRGVTRDPEIGQGNGLAGTHDIAAANGGTFHIWSGNACYRLESGREEVPIPFAYKIGTGIWFSLDTLKPVDLSKTFIGENQVDPNESIFLNNIEELACKDGLKVIEECDHVGVRRPATGLRRKIEAILGNGPVAPIIVDFTKVTGASSSFLDELLGRLFVSLGESGFNARIKLVNLTDEMKRRAEVVVNQRARSAKKPEVP